jgi:hypothetical protein
MDRPDQDTPQQSIGGDRRFDRRYGIALDLRWKLVRRRKVLEAGVGRTVDLSSGGIMFDAGRALPVGLNVELSIAWPALLHDIAPMQLAVVGRIVRTNGSRTAIHMTQHEFRTAGMPSVECVDAASGLAARQARPAYFTNSAPGGKFDTLH